MVTVSKELVYMDQILQVLIVFLVVLMGNVIVPHHLQHVYLVILDIMESIVILDAVQMESVKIHFKIPSKEVVFTVYDFGRQESSYRIQFQKY